MTTERSVVVVDCPGCGPVAIDLPALLEAGHRVGPRGVVHVDAQGNLQPFALSGPTKAAVARAARTLATHRWSAQQAFKLAGPDVPAPSTTTAADHFSREKLRQLPVIGSVVSFGEWITDGRTWLGDQALIREPGRQAAQLLEGFAQGMRELHPDDPRAKPLNGLDALLEVLASTPALLLAGAGLIFIPGWKRWVPLITYTTVRVALSARRVGQ